VAHQALKNVITVIEAPQGGINIADLDFEFSIGQNAWPYMLAVWPLDPRGNGRVAVHDCTFTAVNYTWSVIWGANGGCIYNCTFDGERAGELKHPNP
jgi:hypothetical protein